MLIFTINSLFVSHTHTHTNTHTHTHTHAHTHTHTHTRTQAAIKGGHFEKNYKSDIFFTTTFLTAVHKHTSRTLSSDYFKSSINKSHVQCIMMSRSYVSFGLNFFKKGIFLESREQWFIFYLFTHTHTHTHTHSHKNTHTHTLTQTHHTLSLTHTHTHSLSLK